MIQSSHSQRENYLFSHRPVSATKSHSHVCDDVFYNQLHQLHFELKMSEKIYRFVSFFEAYKLLRHKHLKISKTSIMSDKNEGIIAMLRSIFDSHSGGMLTHDGYVAQHKAIIDNSYISCWSRDPDSIAMWLLYSPQMESIRVSTSIEKLSEVTTAWGAENHWLKHVHSPKGTFQLHISTGEVNEVQYVDTLKYQAEVKARYEEYSQKMSGASSEQDFYNIINDFFVSSPSIPDLAPLLKKDKSYIHEKEIRAIFWGGVRNDLSYDDYQKNISSDKIVDKIRHMSGTATMDKAQEDELPSVQYINVSESLIEEICFDPRMPKYKKEIFIEALGLQSNDTRITTSHVFGYIPDMCRFDF